MKYIEEFREGNNITGVYLCKQKNTATTKNGKEYYNVVIQDKTGSIDVKIWEPNSAGIREFDSLDYIDLRGKVTSFNGALQMSADSIRKAEEGEYIASDYLPVSDKDPDEMYADLLSYIENTNNKYLKKLLQMFFIEDKEMRLSFAAHSAAKTVHHGFVGGLLQHTIAVAKLCEMYCKDYPVINRDLLITSALLHDIGKTKELSNFPENDYTDEGNLLGHIVMGVEMINDKIRSIDGFPEKIGNELKHCIVAHHGELEFGSPKKPAMVEAVALNLADNTDAKLQIMTEILKNTKTDGTSEWLGYSKFLESNIRRTSEI